MDETFINNLASELRKVGTIHTLGEEWVSPTGTIPVGGVHYNGQTVPRSTYPALWEYVQSQDGLVKTDAEWQTLSAAGDVPYYSSGDGSTSFRLPRILGIAHGVYAFGVITESGALDATTLATAVANVESQMNNYLPLRGGNVTGNLTVQSKNVVRSVNSTNADTNGNVTISTPAASSSTMGGIKPAGSWRKILTDSNVSTYSYTAEKNCFIVAFNNGGTNNMYVMASVGGIVIFYDYGHHNNGYNSYPMLFLRKGQTITYTQNASTLNVSVLDLE